MSNALAGRVVERAAQAPVLAEPGHVDEQRVTAADDQTHGGPNLPRPAEERRQEMAFEMVYPQIRFAGADGQALGHRRADHQRTRQPRPGGCREGIVSPCSAMPARVRSVCSSSSGNSRWCWRDAASGTTPP